MKSILSTFKSIQLFGLLVGIAVGTFVALCITYFYVNEGHARMRGYAMSKQYIKDTCIRKFGLGDMNESGMDHDSSRHATANPYMMKSVTSERQFLEDMVLHHEAAVTMARQVLTLNPSEQVKELAEAIMRAQAKEIADMKSWLGK